MLFKIIMKLDMKYSGTCRGQDIVNDTMSEPFLLVSNCCLFPPAVAILHFFFFLMISLVGSLKIHQASTAASVWPRYHSENQVVFTNVMFFFSLS